MLQASTKLTPLSFYVAFLYGNPTVCTIFITKMEPVFLPGFGVFVMFSPYQSTFYLLKTHTFRKSPPCESCLTLPVGCS